MRRYHVMAAAFAALLTIVGSVGSAEARRHPHAISAGVTEFCGDRYCGGGFNAAPDIYQYRYSERQEYAPRRARGRGHEHASLVSMSDGGGAEVGHPSGCPSRAFCGCGASVEVFGHSVRELWLASNWFKFPPAHPAPGMVAVRNHHVFVIREVRAGNMVLAYDANSGGHRTRIHLRSLAGYSVRNPHA